MSGDAYLNIKKKTHYGRVLNGDGDVTPACAYPGRPINHSKENWTKVPSEVTCMSCIQILNPLETQHAVDSKVVS